MNFSKYSVNEYINYARDSMYNRTQRVLLGSEIPDKFYQKVHNHTHKSVDVDTRTSVGVATSQEVGTFGGIYWFEVPSYSFRYTQEGRGFSLFTKNYEYDNGTKSTKSIKRKKYNLNNNLILTTENPAKAKSYYRSFKGKVQYNVCTSYNHKNYELRTDNRGFYIEEQYTHKGIHVLTKISTETYNITLEKPTTKKIGTCYFRKYDRKFNGYLGTSFEFEGEPNIMRFFNNEFIFNTILTNDMIGSDIVQIREEIKDVLKIFVNHFRNKINIEAEIEYYKSN